MVHIVNKLIAQEGIFSCPAVQQGCLLPLVTAELVNNFMFHQIA
jgi:hypothetical protein